MYPKVSELKVSEKIADYEVKKEEKKKEKMKFLCPYCKVKRYVDKSYIGARIHLLKCALAHPDDSKLSEDLVGS